MNRWRKRIDDAKKTPTTFGELTDDSEVREAAKNIWSEAEEHRERVKARDAAAKARRRKK